MTAIEARDEDEAAVLERPLHPAEGLGAAALLLAAEGALIWQLYKDADPVLLGALHLVVAGAASAWCIWIARRGREWGMPALIALGCAFFGPLGPLCGLLAFPLFWLFRRGAEPFDVWFASLYPKDPLSAAIRAYREVVAHGGPAAMTEPAVPFVDILRRGSTEEKIAMVALLARKFHPAFGPVLVEALADPTPAIRVQAATAVNNIERRFMRRLARQERLAAARPRDPAAQRALAQLCDDYAYAGILTEERGDKMRRQALEAWLRYYGLAPGDDDAWLAIGRLLMRLRRYDVAAGWFEEMIEKDHASEQVRLWHLECLYELGRMDELRTRARQALPRIERSDAVPRDLIEAVRLWAGAPAALEHKAAR